MKSLLTPHPKAPYSDLFKLFKVLSFEFCEKSGDIHLLQVKKLF